MEDVSLVNVSKPCSTCYQKETGHGIPHLCTESAMKRNLAPLVLDVDDKGKEQIAAKVLKHIKKNNDNSSKSVEVQLKQMKGGKDLTVTVGKIKVEKAGIVDSLVVAKMEKGLNLSQKDTKQI